MSQFAAETRFNALGCAMNLRQSSHKNLERGNQIEMNFTFPF